jgi:hypothetical protein
VRYNDLINHDCQHQPDHDAAKSPLSLKGTAAIILFGPDMANHGRDFWGEEEMRSTRKHGKREAHRQNTPLGPAARLSCYSQVSLLVFQNVSNLASSRALVVNCSVGCNVAFIRTNINLSCRTVYSGKSYDGRLTRVLKYSIQISIVGVLLHSCFVVQYK